MQDVPKDRMKVVTYGQFVCMVRPEKQNRIGHASQSEETESIIQVNW